MLLTSGLYAHFSLHIVPCQFVEHVPALEQSEDKTDGNGAVEEEEEQRAARGSITEQQQTEVRETHTYTCILETGPFLCYGPQ